MAIKKKGRGKFQLSKTNIKHAFHKSEKMEKIAISKKKKIPKFFFII